MENTNNQENLTRIKPEELGFKIENYKDDAELANAIAIASEQARKTREQESDESAAS